jgi:hypothetical protein
MNDESRRAVIRRFVESVNTGEMEPLDALYHGDVVIEWPQSSELIHGKQNIRELRLAYPTPPKATLRRIVGSGDLWATEMVFDYDGDRFYVSHMNTAVTAWHVRPPTMRRRSRHRPGGRSGTSEHARAIHRPAGPGAAFRSR